VHKSNRSRWSAFLHDLITVDFGQADIYTGLRFATLLVPLLVLGLITRHVGEAFILMLGGGYVLAIDEIRSTGPRTLILLAASVLYASIFAIGMIISLADYFVVPLLAFGLFIISYLRVFPRAFMILMFASTVYVIAIATQGTTLTIISQAFLLIVVGGLWATLSGVIFPARKSSKPALTDGFVQGQHQQQSQSKLTWQDKSKLLTSNLSIHSQYFQYAIALAITSAIGLLITQYFELHEGGWVLITIVVILMPAYTDISLTFNKVVHRYCRYDYRGSYRHNNH
jgi:hypothetical protein